MTRCFEARNASKVMEGGDGEGVLSMNNVPLRAHFGTAGLASGLASSHFDGFGWWFWLGRWIGLCWWMLVVDLSWMDVVWMRKSKGNRIEERSVEVIARHAGRGFARSTSAG